MEKFEPLNQQMQTKNIEPTVELAIRLLNNDPCAIGDAVSELNISIEEIARTQLSNNTDLCGNRLAVLHRKRISAVKKKLRQKLAKIAIENEILERGKKIPDSELCFLQVAQDGFLLGENNLNRIAGFFDPLQKNFVKLILSKV
jgi:hypothetical protein